MTVSLPGQIISKQFVLPNVTGATSYPLDGYAAFGYAIVAVNGLKTTSGSVKATFKIGSTAIPGLNEITVNTTSSNNPVTGGSNVVAPCNTLSVVFDSALSPHNIQFTLVAVRNDAFGGFVNRFRNMAMDVTQRQVNSGVVTSGSTVYTLDGWRITATGGTVTWYQCPDIGLPSGGQATHGLEISGGSGVTSVVLSQRVESQTSAILASQTVTVQLTVDNYTGGSVTPQIRTYYPSTSAYDNWTSPSVDLAATNLQACATGGTTTVAYTFIVSGYALFGYEGDFIFNISGTFTSLYVTAADIRVTPDLATGTNYVNYNPPLPEIRPVAVEFPYCLRYLAGFGESTGIVGLAYSTSTTAFGVYIPFKNKMRVPPTGITETTVGDLAIVDMTGANVAAVTGLSFGNASEDGIFLTGTVAGGLNSNGQSYQLNVNTALAGNVVFTGAEL